MCAERQDRTDGPQPGRGWSAQQERNRIVQELEHRIGRRVDDAYRKLELYSAHYQSVPNEAGRHVADAQRILREALSDIRELTVGSG
jgi:signal transduction histidine kinase